MFNIHEVIGWFRCANLRCTTPLTGDHVTVTTTAHVRRFCSIECIHEGHQAWGDLIHQSDTASPDAGAVLAFIALSGQERSS